MMRIALAGWQFDLICTPKSVAQAVAQQYAPFVANGDAPCDHTIEVEFVASTPGECQQPPILDAKLAARDGDLILDGTKIYGKIPANQQRSSLSVRSADPLRDFEYFLRIAVAVFAYYRGGLLVHGAALVWHERAHLFIGRSGSGKSTVVALSPHAAALGDDLVLLRPSPDGWTVYGTPFWNWRTGERSAQTHHAPLSGIFKLVQARDVELSPMSVAAATAELVVNCPIVNGVDELAPGLLSVCRRLAASTPVRSLHFRKDATFWRLLETVK